MTARTSLVVLLAPVLLMAFAVSHSQAAPLLAVDFGSRLPNSPLQTGFEGMWGTNDLVTTATLGAYTVELSANNTQPTGSAAPNTGFFTKLPGGRIDNTDASIRNFYADYYHNRSTVNGEGISLKLTGLTPNTPYNLTLASFDADASAAVITQQEWGPKAGTNTTGTSAMIDMLREPVPTSLWDPLYSGTIQVSTTTGILDIFGTTSAGSRGAVLNGFKLNDGVNDVLSVDLGEGADATVVPGFAQMSGPHFDADGPSDGATQAFGDYTVSVARVGGAFGDAGFYNEYALRMGTEILPPATHAMFRDVYANVSINEGDGILLTIDGVTPNTEYDLTIWDMDPALPPSVGSPTTWTPTGDTTGPTGNVLNANLPVPQTIDDPNHLTTIRVKSTSAKLEIFGTTTDGFGGVRLNAFALNAVVAAHPGDFDGDGDVDGADFVAWQTHFPTASGATLADGDADGDGDVDGADFVVWQTNFPFTPGPGASPVPEPGAWMLAMLASSAIGLFARRRRACRLAV